MYHELSCSYTHIVHVTLLITCDRWTSNLTICIITNLLFHLNYLGSYGDETCGQMDKETAARTQGCELPKTYPFYAVCINKV